MLRERDVTLRHADEIWEQLRARLDGSSEAPIGGDGGWRGQDVYAHLARWQQRSIDDLRTLLAGGRPAREAEDEDALNDGWAAEDRSMTSTEARDRCLRTRDELRGIVAALGATQWQHFGRLFDDITGPHYEHHLRDAGS